MYREKILDVPLYGGKIRLIATDNLKKLEKHTSISDEDICYNCYDHYYEDKNGSKWSCPTIIINPNFKFDGKGLTPGIVIHECVHAKAFMFARKGISSDPYNDEPEAYFMEWLSDEAISFYWDYFN